MNMFKAMMSARDQATEKAPLTVYAVQLVLVVALYAAGVLGVQAMSGEARLPVILFAVYFLPAVLRAWLQVYWVLRDQWQDVKRRPGKGRRAA